jgi:Uma2 family endonuclease
MGLREGGKFILATSWAETSIGPMLGVPSFDARALGTSQVPIPRRVYDVMVEQGLLTKDLKVELIHGQLVAKMPIGTKHSRMVNTLKRLLFSKLGDRAVIATQNPVALHEYSEPEPDLAIIKLPEMAYENRHPEPEDVFFLIEVADSSLRFDREGKIPLYASCDIPEAWLLDVNAQTLTVYRDPEGARYRTEQVYRAGDTFQLGAFPGVEIHLNELGW